MADTQIVEGTANPTQMPIRAQRSKITLTGIGNPSLVKNMTPEELAAGGGKYFVGSIYGAASDLIERASPDGADKFEGLRGSFVAVPSDRERFEEQESGVMFIPDAFHTLIADKLKEVKKTSDSATVEFAFDCYAIPAKNPAGYSWELVPALPFEGKHPLGSLFEKVSAARDARAKELANGAAKQVTDQSKQQGRAARR